MKAPQCVRCCGASSFSSKTVTQVCYRLLALTVADDLGGGSHREASMRMLRRPIAYLLLVLYVPACTSYRTTNLAPQEAVADEGTVVVTVTNGAGTETLSLKQPWVRNDTVGGIPCRPDRYRQYRCASDENWAVPVSLVVEMQTKRVSTGRTVLAAVGGAFLVLLVGAAACAVDCGFSN